MYQVLHRITHPHVVSDVTTQNILAMSFSVQRLIILAETCEPLLAVRNIQTSIKGTLIITAISGHKTISMIQMKMLAQVASHVRFSASDSL